MTTKAIDYPVEKEDIRIGTLARPSADYIKQIIPHGFESFSITFWQTMGDTDIKKLADEVNQTLEGTGAIISSLGIYGNPLGDKEIDEEARKGWEVLIDNAHLFNTDLVCGFTGRIRGESIPDSIPAYKEFYSKIGERAAGKDIKIAFENCSMGGDWNSGDFNIALNPAAWELMFDALPLDNIGLEWEPCHQMVQLIDPTPHIRDWGHKMFHIHGKDATIHHDTLSRYGYQGPKPWAFHRTPGFGQSDWTEIISELRRIGFKGCIDIEGWHDPVYKDDLEMTGQVHALNYLKRCRGGQFVENPS